MKDVRLLFNEGFAIHWLKPKSKIPLLPRWTSGPRATWAELTSQFEKGFNVGVRLGRVSKLPRGFLAVIDCDVKSVDPKHKKEMHRALLKFFPGAMNALTVISGRGNGSQHVYVVTETPAAPKRITQSSERVKVFYPSVKPSKKDLSELGEAECAKGFRMRPAWEISLMGEGQQVVLPPSIHPDSGKPYVWAKPFDSDFIKDIPKFLVPDTKLESTPKAELQHGVEFIDVDLDLLSLDEKTVALIREGEDCDDRSVGLFVAARAMVRQGLSDIEILSVLTDTDNFLGETAYDHAKTTDRNRAASWLMRFTLAKVRKEFSVEADFGDSVVVTEILSAEEAKAQEKEIIDNIPWQTRLDKNQFGNPKNSLKNAILILENSVGTSVFRHNEFSGLDLYGMNTPWGGRLGGEISDTDIIAIKIFIEKHFRYEPSSDKLNEAVAAISRKNCFHPVRDYLNTLEWDGIPRIETWLKVFCNAEGPDSYLRAVSKKLLVAMVARVFEPGVKFDQVLILEGYQGGGKSTAIKNLVGDEWFSDTPINFSDKDSVINMRGVWVMELGELNGMRQADVELLKAYISRTNDRLRLPYGRRVENFPRQTIFVGSTNRDEYLKDFTGNRRYWPVKVGKCDFKKIKKFRDQLLAEAVFAYDLGETLYLEDAAVEQLARGEQESRLVHDSLSDHVESFFAKLKERPENERGFPLSRFTLHEAFSDFGPFAGYKDTRLEQLRAADALRSAGFLKRDLKRNGKTTKLWISKDDSEKHVQNTNDLGLPKVALIKEGQP